ncbi:hypothetical protein PV10_02479 [Exophiala mesophila]|uniref:Major facilitator superfamily (MFS) profile domain-containing protein n=1 Tax=Exophiala mesophila TaxID=212818 RepID=A0A0D1Y2D5_EXOME|nr:uncharacterized protein PV10_02479 [Exophiala mesophila]KIV94746.1 hypothetical protein PV10_02479 [Exophiala mesophila]
MASLTPPSLSRPPSSSASRGPPPPKSQPAEGVIRVQQSVTVEEVVVPENANPNQSTLFGDASRFYQATVCATSRFAHDLFSATTLREDPGDDESTPARNKRWIVTAVLLALVNLICTMVDTMLPVMLPEIMYDLDIQGFQWVLAGVATGAAATTLAAGQLYGVFPFKQVYALFAVLFLIGTISPALASNMLFIFYARLVQGIGMAGLKMGAMIFLDHEGSFTDKSRRDFFVLVSGAIGLILGPFLGSLFAARHRFWDWAFYTTFMLLALVFVPLVYILPNRLHVPLAVSTWSPQGTLAWRVLSLKMDTLGSVLSFTGLMTLFISINLAGTYASWYDSYTYVPISVGGAVLVSLVIQQTMFANNEPWARLFPCGYCRHIKSMALFMLTCFICGILQTTLPYTALYQLLSGAKGSAVDTAVYLFFNFSAPHLIPTLLVPVYVGSGLVTSYPLVPSYSIWSLGTGIFLMAGTAILFLNTPTFFPEPSGMPRILQQFSLASIGWWSAMTLSLAHQIIDVLQPANSSMGPERASYRHPYHNRSFIQFAAYLGAAIALTGTGNLFMTLGPRWELQAIRKDLAEFPNLYSSDTRPDHEDARVALLGYTFIRNGTTPTLFEATIDTIKETFGWSSLVGLSMATLAFITSVILVVYKIWTGDLDWRNRVVGNVPREWRVEEPASSSGQQANETVYGEDGNGPAIELVERTGTATPAGTPTGTGTATATATPTRTRTGTGTRDRDNYCGDTHGGNAPVNDGNTHGITWAATTKTGRRAA